MWMPIGEEPPAQGPPAQAPPELPFVDEHHAYLLGFGDGTIRPQDNISRAEVATIFFRLIEDDFRAEMWRQAAPYSDVNRNNWHNNAIAIMSNAGLFRGLPDGSFRPNASITRAEFAAVAARFLEEEYFMPVGVRSMSGGLEINDVDGHWTERYINTIIHFDWARGFGDGTFRPNDNITRAEVAANCEPHTGPSKRVLQLPLGGHVDLDR